MENLSIEKLSIEKLIKFLQDNKDSLEIKKDFFGEIKLSINDSKNNLDKPYINELLITTNRLYNENYGDDRKCKCGHSYYRHFDSYEDMEACGCKYCGCHHFEEDK